MGGDCNTMIVGAFVIAILITIYYLYSNERYIVDQLKADVAARKKWIMDKWQRATTNMSTLGGNEHLAAKTTKVVLPAAYRNAWHPTPSNSPLMTRNNPHPTDTWMPKKFNYVVPEQYRVLNTSVLGGDQANPGSTFIV